MVKKIKIFIEFTIEVIIALVLSFLMGTDYDVQYNWFWYVCMFPVTFGMSWFFVRTFILWVKNEI